MILKRKNQCSGFERGVVALLLSAHQKLDRISVRLDLIEARLESIEHKLDQAPARSFAGFLEQIENGQVQTATLRTKDNSIDVRLKGVSTERLRDLAMELQRGGVGYYKKSDFVHVDTARVRYWEG